jgi:curved DNA-binding protein CbpA
VRPDSKKDYYATLGVLPTAEDIVIRAAYRALAQRYHPDRFNGSKEEANARMAEINEAYEVLSDSTRRKDYDASRGSNAQSGEPYFGEKSNDAPPSFDPLEYDWGIALKYYPDLAVLEAKLSRISWRLAYSFRAHLLEVKLFDQRTKVAEALEQKFLETYFGTNPQILSFARDLVALGHKAASKRLNETVRVLGRGIEPNLVIKKIRDEFKIGDEFELYREFALRLRSWGYGEEDIRDQLVSRGLGPKEADILARMVARGKHD